MTEESKGWKRLVSEAIERIVREEITRQLDARFPRQSNHAGFSVEARRYVEERFTTLMKDDPEINAVIKEGLLQVLREGFAEKKS